MNTGPVFNSSKTSRCSTWLNILNIKYINGKRQNRDIVYMDKNKGA